MPGSLFVVATPIGNLEDLTFRALRTMKEVDLIAAEDTRRTSKLLAHYGVSKPLMSLHEHNEHREAPRLVDRIAGGLSVALVSDAGTPAISDPGTTLVRLCRERGLIVEAIPGPSAVTAALSISGIPATPFVFMGFPPSSGVGRSDWFDHVRDVDSTVVFFEAPHRIGRTLDELGKLPKRTIIVHREITKIHQKSIIWPSIEDVESRGEFVVVLGPLAQEAIPDIQVSAPTFHEMLSGLGGLNDEQVLAATAGILDVPIAMVRKAIKKAKILAKQQNQ